MIVLEKMPIVHMIIWLAILLLATLNLLAIKSIFKSHLFSKNQKIAQTIFIWLIPVVGALLAMHFSKIENKKTNGNHPNNSSLESDPISSSQVDRLGREDYHHHF